MQYDAHVVAMNLEMRHLRLVRAVATGGTLTEAGRHLHLSQSALSHQLRDVEDGLGTRLFLRVGKRMLLTAAGERLLRSADQVLDVLQRTEDEIRELAGGRRGVLRISAGACTRYHWLPPVLRDYRRVWPDVDVRVDADGAGDLVRLLIEGRLDVGIVNDPPHDHRIVERPLFDDEIVVIVHPSHVLASRRYVRSEDFAGQTLLLDGSPEESAIFQHVLAPTGATPAGLQQVGHPGAIIELVKAGLGIAVLPRWEIEPVVEAGDVRAVPLLRGGSRRPWSAAVLKEMAEVDYIREFIDVVARCAPRSVRETAPCRPRFEAGLQ